MFIDIEETLRRELHDVAEGLQIPPMHPLPKEPSRARRHWRPLLAAAAVVLLVAGGIVLVAISRDSTDLEPAVPPPSPTESVRQEPTPPNTTRSNVNIPTTAPAVPYVLNQRLYVGGEQVPGDWWSVWGGDAAWLAWRADNTWWWGTGSEANEMPAGLEGAPVLSPNGRYVAATLTENGRGLVTAFTTEPGGEGLGGIPVDLGSAEDGSTVSIRAVTNDGKVIAQGTRTSLLWLPLAGNTTVNLAVTAPGQVILDGTAAGLIVTDGEDGEPYLADSSNTGELTPIGAVPAHDDMVISPHGDWLAWTVPGTLGGEVTSISTLEAQTVDGTQRTTLTAPAGWGFRVQAYVWEDDDHLVSPVVGDGGERMARCSVQAGRCVLIETP